MKTNVEGPQIYLDEISYENFKKSAPFPDVQFDKSKDENLQKLQENLGENWLCLCDLFREMILEEGPKIRCRSNWECLEKSAKIAVWEWK